MLAFQPLQFRVYEGEFETKGLHNVIIRCEEILHLSLRSLDFNGLIDLCFFEEFELALFSLYIKNRFEGEILFLLLYLLKLLLVV